MALHGLDKRETKGGDAGEGTLFVPKSIPSPDPTREKAVLSMIKNTFAEMKVGIHRSGRDKRRQQVKAV